MSVLSDYRERLGLSQSKLASRIGVHRISVYRWEHGTKLNVLLKVFVDLCDALHLNSSERNSLRDYFLGRDEKRD